MRTHYPIAPSQAPITPTVDLAPIETRIAQLESKVIPPVSVPAGTEKQIQSSSAIALPPIATGSPDISTAEFKDYWQIEYLSDGMFGLSLMFDRCWFRLTWIATGYNIEVAGVYSTTSNQPWTLRELNLAGGGTTSRSLMPTSLGTTSKSFAYTGNQVSVVLPGSGKSFPCWRPRTDITTGWERIGQDTRLQYPKFLYQQGNLNLLIFWVKNGVHLTVWGAPGIWSIDHDTTVPQATQTVTVSGDGSATWGVEVDVPRVRVVPPTGNPVTLYRPVPLTAWACNERPDPNALQLDWTLPSVTIGSVCYFQWHSIETPTEYIRATFYPFTLVEHVRNSIQVDDWFRLTRADGTQVTGKAPIQYNNQQFALMEIWANSGLNASIPFGGAEGTANLMLPLPIIPGEKALIPSLWTQYLERKAFLKTIAGEEISSLKTSLANLQTSIATLQTSVSAIQTAIAPNLADTNLGTFDPTSNNSHKFFLPFRAGAKIKEITFTFRDRRVASFPTRSANVILPGSELSGNPSSWAYSWNASDFRHNISKTFTLQAGADFIAAIQWIGCPAGITLWFQESHTTVFNTYGRFENVLVKWERA